MQLERYVYEMRKPKNWGGAIEIKAFADLFHKNIKVVTSRNKVIEFLSSQPDRCGWIYLRWNGRHYSPILNR